MSQGGFDITPVIAALIGAISGSFGGNIINDRLRQKNEKDTLRRTIIDKYLFQLQDSITSLWSRLDNIKTYGGRQVMDNLYYEESTLYALAIVFAYDRILLLEGIYSQIQGVIPGLGIFLQQKLNKIESEMGDESKFRSAFYKYDRLALGDSVLQRINDKFQISTYLEFREKYEERDSSIKSSLEPAKRFVAYLNKTEANAIMNGLSQIALEIKKKTGILTEIDKTQEMQHEH